MSNISLYNIQNRFTELFEKAENEELTEEEIQEQGQKLAIELQKKSTSIIGYSKQLELTSNAIQEEIDRLTNMKKAIDNRQNRFKQYVKENMERLGLEKIETPLGVLTIAKNPISVEIVSEAEVPEKFKKSKVTITVDKTAIKEHFKATREIINGVNIITNKTSLRIK